MSEDQEYVIRPQVGQCYKVQFHSRQNLPITSTETYVVRGIDPVRDRFWLCVDEAEYESYNGDLIVYFDQGQDRYIIYLADERCNFSLTIKLVLV